MAMRLAKTPFAAIAIAAGSVPLLAGEPPVLPQSGGFVSFLSKVWNADGSSDAVSVSSQTYNGYKRKQLPDGRYEPETYAFAEGGYGGGTAAGQPADRMPFLKIVHRLAGPLAAQNYVPSRAPETTELMILVFWGVTNLNGMPGYEFSSTLGPTNTAGGTGAGQLDAASIARIGFDNYWRHEDVLRNARILGYSKELIRVSEVPGLSDRMYELADELQDARYYVVLQAYDFPKARDQKRLVLLWSTRYSIRERRNDFDRDLAAMTRRASRYFGQDSHGLQRKLSFRSSVDIGELKVIEFDPQAVREIGPPEADQPPAMRPPENR
jgi:hypothetical protein